MIESSERSEIAPFLLPGRPDDYLGTVVSDRDLVLALETRAGIEALLSDALPLPRTAARNGHSDDRHLEYWLSGWRDAQAVMRATGLKSGGEQRVLGLEFAGCGRVTRHIVREVSDAQVFFGVADPVQLRIMEASLQGRGRAFNGSLIPDLPFPDASFDGAYAVSTFAATLDSCAWLLDIKRVLKAGAKLYVTLRDGESWSMLRAAGAGPPEEDPCPEEHARSQERDPAAASQLRVLSGSALLRLWRGIFNIEAIEALPTAGEIGVVLRLTGEAGPGGG